MRETVPAIAGIAAVAATTFLYGAVLHLSNAATVSTTFLLIVLMVAAVSTLRIAIATSLVSVLVFNFFFLPPVGTFTIADPQNWVALAAFLAVSVIGSNLSATARARTREATARRDEMARLFDLSRDVLLMSDSREALTHLARSIGRRFDLDYVAIALPFAGDWLIADGAGEPRELDRRELSNALAAAETRMEFDAYQRSYVGHREIATAHGAVRLVPLRVGGKPVGLLAAAGRTLDPGALDALGGVVAIGIERVRFLDERKSAELTRQSEELKTTILASVGHDLRTPLTTIKVAATNLQSPSLSEADRAEQAELVLAEAERLSRLFEDLLDMARIDAHAVATAVRRVHPSEVIAAAREPIERTLAGHPLKVDIDVDQPVALDPRLIASALSHLLENAAQYAPQGTAIDLRWRTSGDGVTISVRDQGPGIPAADLPRLFTRFYRGEHGRARHGSTGMGLWIVRGLLAAHNGTVWADNCADRGAEFTINVPMAGAANA